MGTPTRVVSLRDLAAEEAVSAVAQAARQFARLAAALGLTDTGHSFGEIVDAALTAREGEHVLRAVEMVEPWADNPYRRTGNADEGQQP